MTDNSYGTLSFHGIGLHGGMIGIIQYFNPAGDFIQYSNRSRVENNCGRSIHPRGNSNLDTDCNGDGTIGYVVQQEFDSYGNEPRLAVGGVVFHRSPGENRRGPPAGVKLVLPPGYIAEPSKLIAFITETTKEFESAFVSADGSLRMDTGTVDDSCCVLADKAAQRLRELCASLKKAPTSYQWERNRRAFSSSYPKILVMADQSPDIMVQRTNLQNAAIQLVQDFQQGNDIGIALMSKANFAITKRQGASIAHVQTQELTAPTALSSTETAPPTEMPTAAPPKEVAHPAKETEVFSSASQQVFGETKAQADMITFLLNQIAKTAKESGPTGEHARTTLLGLGTAFKSYTKES